MKSTGEDSKFARAYIGRRLMAPTAERMRIRLAVFDGKQRWWLVGHQDAKLVTCRSINGFDMVTGQARFQEGDRIRFRRSKGFELLGALRGVLIFLI